jgi:hypothetical protein
VSGARSSLHKQLKEGTAMENGSAYLAIVGGGIGVDLLQHLLSENEPVETVVLTRPTQAVIDLAPGRFRLLEYYRDSSAFEQIGGRYAWLLNLWSSTKIPANVLALAGHRINLHPGLLPATRGGDCVTWAMRKCLPIGASLIEIDPTIDTGAVYVERALPYTFPSTAGAMHQQVKSLCLSMFKQHWPEIRDGKILPVPQRGEPRTYLHRETAIDQVRNLNHDDAARDFIEWALSHDFQGVSSPLVTLDGQTYALSLQLTPVRTP